MTFRIALSGLNAASTELEVTGNNIANSGTNGFKESRTEFGDLFANAIQDTANAAGQGACGAGRATVQPGIDRLHIQQPRPCNQRSGLLRAGVSGWYAGLHTRRRLQCRSQRLCDQQWQRSPADLRGNRRRRRHHHVQHRCAAGLAAADHAERPQCNGHDERCGKPQLVRHGPGYCVRSRGFDQLQPLDLDHRL